MAFAFSITVAVGVPLLTITIGLPQSMYAPINAVAILGFPAFLLGMYFSSGWLIERRFLTKWDPVFYERTGTSLSDSIEREVMLRLTDSMEFMALSREEQRRIAAEQIAKAKQRAGIDA